jgi:Ssp1 endopeptidase immunity protein Rap1a
MSTTRSRTSLLTGAALILATTLSLRMAIAEPERSPDSALISGCRELAELIIFSNSGDDPYQKGLCSGMITSLGFLGKAYDVCLPAGTTFQQAANVIVQYIDGRPQAPDEKVMPLIVEALKDAWRCPVETRADMIKDGPFLSPAASRIQRAN